MRRSFDAQLEKLQEDILALTSMVEEALLESADQLKRRDVAASRQLIQRDKAIDELRYSIEADALGLFAMQQPMASDMRTLAATLFIANELERIGDYAKGIARANIRIGDELLIKPLVDIPRMAGQAHHMVHHSVKAFVDRNVALANAVIGQDAAVDDLHDQIYGELMGIVTRDASTMRQANLLLMVSHNLERAADRATNICERVIYCVTGRLVDTGGEDTVS